MQRLLEILGKVPPARGQLDLATVEATSLHTVSALITVAALARAESRGCHRWRDVPVTRDHEGRHTVLRAEEGQPVIDGAVAAAAGASGMSA
jgi:L-aspartate oxidase